MPLFNNTLWFCNSLDNSHCAKHGKLLCNKQTTCPRLLFLFHSHHVQQGLVVPEGSDHAHHWHCKHHQAQEDEHHSRRQEKPLQGSILLPLNFGIHPDTQHTETHQLQVERERRFMNEEQKWRWETVFWCCGVLLPLLLLLALWMIRIIPSVRLSLFWKWNFKSHRCVRFNKY